MMSIAKGKISLWFCSSLDIKYFRCSLFSEFESNFFINTICDLGYKNVFLNFYCGFSPKKVSVLPCSSQNSAPTRRGGGRTGREGWDTVLNFFPHEVPKYHK